MTLEAGDFDQQPLTESENEMTWPEVGTGQDAVKEIGEGRCSFAL